MVARDAQRDDRLVWVYVPLGLAAPTGVVMLARGMQYSGLALLALASTGALDYSLGSRMMLRPRFHVLLAVVALLTGVFNGYLTGRPVVLYDESYLTAVDGRDRATP